MKSIKKFEMKTNMNKWRLAIVLTALELLILIVATVLTALSGDFDVTQSVLIRIVIDSVILFYLIKKNVNAAAVALFFSLVTIPLIAWVGWRLHAEQGFKIFVLATVAGVLVFYLAYSVILFKCVYEKQEADSTPKRNAG